MENFVITIARQYGSGGRTVGQMLAKRLGVPFYGKEIIRNLCLIIKNILIRNKSLLIRCYQCPFIKTGLIKQ